MYAKVLILSHHKYDWKVCAIWSQGRRLKARHNLLVNQFPWSSTSLSHWARASQNRSRCCSLCVSWPTAFLRWVSLMSWHDTRLSVILPEFLERVKQDLGMCSVHYLVQLIFPIQRSWSCWRLSPNTNSKWSQGGIVMSTVAWQTIWYKSSYKCSTIMSKISPIWIWI